jgi:hypothetical protein
MGTHFNIPLVLFCSRNGGPENYLCTGAFLYVCYSFLLISINLLHCAHFTKLWALESPIGAHEHKTTYGPLIYTAPYIMVLMRPNPLIEIFWALRNGIEPLGVCYLWPKKVSISGPNPLTLDLVIDLAASQALHTGTYKS